MWKAERQSTASIFLHDAGIIIKQGAYQMEIQAHVLQNMASLGFLAANQGRLDKAEQIFQGLAAIRPEEEAVLLGLAYIRLNMGAFGEAADILQNKAMTLYPDNEIIACFGGLALHRDGKADAGRDLLHRVSKTGKDPLVVNLATNLLAELEG